MFNEKTSEYSVKQCHEISVWQSPKYEQSKAKALDAMKQMPYLKEGDFWILMNETKSGKMGYTGLIISHNACLKINDAAPEDKKFKPSLVSVNQTGYGGALVFTYINDAQGIYEVGEVTAKNCKNDYPYAMAFKRLFDRVVLKICKLAFDGIYSDSEADEFREPTDSTPSAPKQAKQTSTLTPASELPAPVKCPVCGKPIKRVRKGDKILEPDEVLQALGCCADCHNKQKAEA